MTIGGLAYDGAVDEGSVLRRSVGRRVVFRLPESKDTISALVLGVDPLRLQLPDGSVTFSPPGAAIYPGDVVVADPTATSELSSAKAQDRLRLGYFTTGAAWRASYQVVLGDGRRAGDRQRGDREPDPPGRGRRGAAPGRRGGAGAAAGAAACPTRRAPWRPRRWRWTRCAATEQRVGEFHLYSLPGRTSLLPGLTSTIALFEPAAGEVRAQLRRARQVPWWGMLPQQGDETEAPVEVIYTLKRPRKTEFGDRPLPGGVVRLFQADSAGRAQLIGEAAMDHTPGRRGRPALGRHRVRPHRAAGADHLRDPPRQHQGRLAHARHRRLQGHGPERDRQRRHRRRAARSGPASGACSRAACRPEKVSSTITRFRVKVPARGETTLTYRVRVVW